MRKSLPRKHVLLYGSTGIGKTSSAYVWAYENHYHLVEINSSDDRGKDIWIKLTKTVKKNLMSGKTVFLLDECDGIQWRHKRYNITPIIKKILETSIHPFILTANDAWKVPEEIKKLVTEIKFYSPYPQEIVTRLKKAEKEFNLKLNYSSISGDIRNSFISVLTNSEKMDLEKDPFTLLKQLFLRGIITGLDFKEHIHWISQNIPNAYDGFKMIEAFEVLEIANFIKSIEPLKLLPRTKKIKTLTSPYFNKRLKQVMSKKNVGSG